MKYTLFLISLFLHLCIIFGDSQAAKPRRCTIAYKCSSKSDTVWATTDSDVKKCELFRNSCYMLNENCQRLNRNEPEAYDIGKEKCQELCKAAPECPKDGTPVCGYFDEENKSFSSQCEMDKYNCETGKTFDLFTYGACPEN